MRRTSALIAFAALVAPVMLPARMSSAVEPSTSPTTSPSTRPAMRSFDPARHMRTSEVRPGMKGYGLTVLSGSEIVRFPVEVISVLHDMFGPKSDVVMVRCLDDFMKNTGPIQGCSGSPIFLVDDSGRERMLGAYAYGFDLAKEPIIGVQPIEQMLTLPTPNGIDVQRATGVPMSFSLLDAGLVAKLRKPGDALHPIAAPRALFAPGAPHLAPLATPLAIGGVSQTLFDQLSPTLRDDGFQPMMAMATASDDALPAPKIEPGSVLAAQMMGGDLELTAVGTCTEVIDGRAYGFGHPFNGEGATSIPMGAGQIHLVMPVLTASFKIGSMSAASGAIDMDGSFGIAGMIGATAKTVPVTVEVIDNTLGTTKTFHYQAALHRTYTPDMIAMALQASVLSDRNLPLEHTARYEVSLKFAGNRELKLGDAATSLDGFTVIRETAVPIVAMMNNPFQSVPIEAVTARMQIDAGIAQRVIETATPAKPSYSPGETARIHVRLRTPSGASSMHVLDVPLPRTLPDGDYVIVIGDATTNLELEAENQAYRFTVRDIDELFVALTSITSTGRSDAVYGRLITGRAGVSIGRTPLQRMPPSRLAILTGAGRPDMGATAETSVVSLPIDGVVRGRVDVTIHVRKRLPR